MLNDKIRAIRIKNGMSQSELARRSGHAVSTIHGIENGNNQNPSFKMIGDIAMVLGISLDELYRECYWKPKPLYPNKCKWRILHEKV